MADTPIQHIGMADIGKADTATPILWYGVSAFINAQYAALLAYTGLFLFLIINYK